MSGTAIAPPSPSALPIFRSVDAAERVLDNARAELGRAETPAAKNRARLAIELIAKCLANALASGEWRFGEVHRQGQELSLEAAIETGSTALSPAPGAPTSLVVLRDKALQEKAREAGVPTSTLRDMAKLALARELRGAEFDAIVKKALDERKLPPLAKLRALAPRKPSKRRKPGALTEGVHARFSPAELAALDRERGTTPRGKWVSELAVEALADDAAARLLERVAVLLRREDSARARNAVALVDGAITAVRA